ncbi:OLC1v1028045C1 [Oldenlandia corymbosa var. corymbosa]|uniref:OLC1v1028045C1 n=1 Tax=Oldenlandia corymbosa var. corymbosa TaxID=529605 RepID=A0AAV1CDI3_OLDCO|nr:OLC1v1028045C1 [Oldenlandia corymbosa var. corymbosa]
MMKKCFGVVGSGIRGLIGDGKVKLAEGKVRVKAGFEVGKESLRRGHDGIRKEFRGLVKGVWDDRSCWLALAIYLAQTAAAEKDRQKAAQNHEDVIQGEKVICDGVYDIRDVVVEEGVPKKEKEEVPKNEEEEALIPVEEVDSSNLNSTFFVAGIVVFVLLLKNNNN